MSSQNTIFQDLKDFQNLSGLRIQILLTNVFEKLQSDCLSNCSNQVFVLDSNSGLY